MNARPPPRFLLAAMVLTAGLAAHPAAPADLEALETLDPVVVYGRSLDLVGEAGTSSQGQVGAPELAERPLLRRGELLEVVPGLVVTQHSGSGKANQYFLRGFNLDHGTDFAVSVDGMPVNARSHAHGQGYADTNFIIPELIERVDYQKGAFAAENGDFSAAGAAQFSLVRYLPKGFAKIEFGEDDFARAVVGETFRQPGGSTAATTIAAEAGYADGPWEKPEASRRLSAFGRHVWSAGASDYAVSAMGYDGRWNSSDQIPLRAVESGAIGRYGNLDASDGGASRRASLSFDRVTRQPDATTLLNAYVLRSDLDLYSNFTYFIDDPVNGDQFNQREDRVQLGGSASRTWAGTLADRSLLTSVGLQIRQDFIDVGLHHTSDRRRLATVRRDDVREGSAGLFAESTLAVAPWLRATAGSRGDFYVFDVEGRDPVNSGTETAGIFSPKLGLVAGPWAKTELYANAGLGFHSNDARGVTDPVDPATPLVQAKNVELGVRTSALPGLVSTVSVWRLDFDSELAYVGDAGATEAGDPTRRYGVEFANFYQATSWLAFDADLAFTHARYTGNPTGGDRIANSISTVYTAGVVLKFESGWSGSLRARYFGPQPLNEDASITAPESLTFNARLARRLGNWEFALDVLNVFDRENYDVAYAYESRLATEAAPVLDTHFHPAEPRTVRASVTRRF